MAEAMSSFWGPVTSAEWCEKNNVYSSYIAEFFNTVSNIPGILLALIGLINALRQRFEKRFSILHISNMILAIGRHCIGCLMSFARIHWVPFFRLLIDFDEEFFLAGVGFSVCTMAERGPRRVGNRVSVGSAGLHLQEKSFECTGAAVGRVLARKNGRLRSAIPRINNVVFEQPSS
ncbi:ALKALINE CERAMIDASE [Salix koriyanagi]|uniref:ALKALINE CERAMIDASE n=1 Tax=Salix koriyanagi TaxID=2511006 RepID=A0A9Q0X1C4_9ROSI|nr:ALKALINE CERAMIDASE [Salix koriyanagi]